jgi:hypothetical protein
MANAQFAKVGTSGFQFLKIGVGARGVALGNAYTALADDPMAIFWNPAGIAQVEKFGLGGAVTQWPADIYISSAAAVYNLGKYGTIGASFSLMTTGLMNIVTVYNPGGNEGSFEVGDWVAGLTYARAMTDHFTVGVTFKLIRETLGNFESMGLGNFEETVWAIDIGSYYNTGFKNLRVGMSIMNFGPEAQYQVDDDLDGEYDEDIRDGLDNDNDGVFDEDTEEAGVPLPLIFRVGLAMDIFESENHKLTAVADMYHPPDNKENYNIGAEYWLFNMIALRGGYSIQMDEGGLCAGVGAKIDAFGLGTVCLDYAYADLGVLSDMVHRMSFSLTF